jgi:hypothetical protein
MLIAETAGRLESRLLMTPFGRIELVFCAGLFAVLVRVVAVTRKAKSGVIFEEEEPPVLTSLGLSA